MDESELDYENSEEFSSDTTDDKPKTMCQICKCFWRPLDNSTIINCEGLKLDAVPKFENSSEIYAANNAIEVLQEEDVPNTLMYLDLQYNHIKNIDQPTLFRLFSLENRTMKFAGNPFSCGCDNKDMIETLHLYQKQVLDYNHLTCVDRTPLSTIDPSLLCRTQIMVISIMSVLGILLLILSGVYIIWKKFGFEIKVFMHSKGWRCCSAEDNEEKKEYDVFISFAQEDEEFVTEELLPKLEAESLTVCVHHRDWCAGDWIPAQIAKSVASSKKTLVVLSNNFLKSPWALLEFRAAHAQTVQEGRARLVVLLLEDVLDDNRLDAELRAYLATTTYVRWGASLYWEKLLYALPNPKHTEKRRDELGSGHEVITLIRPNDPKIRALQDCPFDLIHSTPN